jgi:hypothetical protein
VNPNATWNVYLQPQEVSKGPTTLGTYGSLPKNGKGRFGFLNHLGVTAAFLVTDLELVGHSPITAYMHFL